ncbi:hypothetical protein PC116_g17110 [Phytophthora cactorum]|uniref:Uncharacterized protein n=1 Tax=Phytophthora cactorum TaxID=29920 RepID=A0A8T1FSU3_9STRA|nr:hypothetical protein Pcac1_g5916 [Phytophthora cactorum]KAG3111827.1 hypothetical protein PI125_g8759 [Phytophthora idaei]KAG2816649.1 hypothetical protein PC111_g13060 [Phytophthora cactorum]KAG2853257.1 hypothetical protein PC113_g14337 [Phytophthora cactorum]KAG2896031.1 hypothetical protein PC114_g15275 [Phytophthora cactorum]
MMRRRTSGGSESDEAARFGDDDAVEKRDRTKGTTDLTGALVTRSS